MLEFLKKIVFSLIICLGINNLNAQNNLTMYNMHTLPQQISTNPSQTSDSRFFIGVPGLSSTHFIFGNDGFKIKQVISVNDSNQLEFNTMKFYNALNENNIIGLDVNYDLFYMGFKLRKSFLAVSLGERLKTQFSFPKDFFGLLLIGNAGSNLGQDLNFKFGADAMLYNDLGVSWSRGFKKDKLRLGAKFSYINGLVNINTEKSDIIFNTNTDDFHYTISTDIKVNTSCIMDTLNSTFKYRRIDPNLLKGQNRGMGLSFGATYNILPKLTISGSILNLGFINWNENVQNYQTANPSQKVEFYGFDLNRLFGDSSDTKAYMNELKDSLLDKFKLTKTNKAYQTSLPSTFYFGGNIWITKRHNFGVLFYGSYFQKKLNPAITLSFNAKFTKAFGLSVSYSMINKSFVNGGVGLTLNGGPLQFYLVADNILGIIQYRNANTIDIRAGINLTFLRKDKKVSAKGKGKVI